MALLTLLLSTIGLQAQQAGTSPVKIFILAGQSNMQGQGNMTPATTQGTLEYIVANDPDSDYQFLVDGDGGWALRDDVWIKDEDGQFGGLTAGYGSNSDTVGPELGFGHHVGDLYEKQVLLVKAAWGGKSLGVDFRPPSSGDTTGFYYNEILRLVNDAIANLETYFPDYNAAGGYEIAGFGWHQGWNDRVDADRSAEYEANMANFIRDIRSSEHGLGVPDLPFVIATTGMDGSAAYTTVEFAQLAMANTTAYPDFAGNVAVIDTRTSRDGLDFWQSVDSSPADQGYHWNRNAQTYVNIGLAMADAMSTLSPARCPTRLRATGGSTGGVTLTWQNGSEAPTSVQVLRDRVEIAAAAPASPTTYLDPAAQPGVHDYELVFTMPGDPCDPLTVTFDGGITDLDAFRSPGGVTLNWTTNMAYDAIAIRRDGTLIKAALSGTAQTYTDTTPPASGLVTYNVEPTNGSTTPAEIQISLDGPAPGNAVLYEPFDYETGALNGKDGGIGFAGPWGKTLRDPQVTGANNDWGSLPTLGNRVNSNSWSAMTRPIGTTLNNAGLMDDGSTLWFSYVMDIEGQNLTNLDFNFALCSDRFDNNYGDRINLLSGEGIGVGNITAGRIRGAYWQNSDADSIAERTLADTSLQLDDTYNARALIVGRIDWGADENAPEQLTLYAPGTDLTPGTPILDSWETAALDQSLFDTLSVEWKDDAPSIDEIRFGTSYDDVIGADLIGDYVAWAATYSGAELSDPDGDFDDDGLTNNEERIWGLDPTSASSFNPYAVPLDATGAFRYTRRDPSLSGLTYTVWTSTNLQVWIEDTSADQRPETPDANDVETVAVTLSPELLATPELFVQMRATE